MLKNSFVIKIVMKRFDTIVPIIPLIIQSLAKAKFCNVFSHPIKKSVWVNLSDFDIISQLKFI